MMHKRIASLFVLLALMLVGAPALSQAARFAPDAEVREAFASVVLEARASVVELVVAGDTRVLGTVVDEQGYVLTKASELEGADQIKARLPIGKLVPAELVGVDRKNDLAMLKIDAPRLKAVRFVDDEPGVGRWVACVGVERSPVAVGIISAQAREIKPAQLVLGVILREHPKGLAVLALSKGFGADQAGVKIGDVLTRVDSKKVIAVQQLVDRLQSQAEGDEVVIEVNRGDDSVKLTVKLSELEPDPRSRSERMNRMGGAVSERRQGFERVLQHDAEIRPEHCGGPVVNLEGEVIGLNIARAGRIATYTLPSSVLREKLAALKAGHLAPATQGQVGEAVSLPEPEVTPSKQ